MTFAGECQIRVTFIANFTPCSNWGNWQYQAGVGNDPRSFRQFNQIKKANDYDADAKYILTWIPELRQVDRRFAHTPWRKSHKIQAGFVLTRFLQCYHPRRRGSIVWASKADTLRRLCLNSLNGRNTTPKKKAHMDHAQAAVMPRRTMREVRRATSKSHVAFPWYNMTLQAILPIMIWSLQVHSSRVLMCFIPLLDSPSQLLQSLN